MTDRIGRYLFAALLLLCAIFAHGSTTTLTGTITDSQGNPMNGVLVMRLPVPAQDLDTNTAIAPTPVYFNLVNGVITGGAPLKDVGPTHMQPNGLFYIARAYDTTGALQFYGNYVVTGTTFNLGAATPTSVTTSNVSYILPIFPNQTNSFTAAQTFTTILSASSPDASTGFIRMANTDQICWRNAGNTADVCQNAPLVVASGTQNLGSATVNAGGCVSVNTVATGAVSGQAVAWAYTNTNPSTADLKLVVAPLVFPNGIGWQICNPSAGNLTQSGNATVAYRLLP